MTAKTRSALKIDSAANIDDNTTGNVSPQDVRDHVDNIVDSVGTLKDNNTFEKTQRINAGTTAYSASITIDLNESNYHAFTLTGNPLFNVPSNATAGDEFCLVLTQDATGSRQPTYNAAFDFGAGDGSLAGTANKTQVIHCIYHSASFIECVVGAEQG